MSDFILSNGYKATTTFWTDFTIADAFGEDAVLDTFNRAFAEWKSNYVYLTELVIVLNHKVWQHYKTNEKLYTVYLSLWEEADAYAIDNLKGDELSYFFNVTD